MGRKPYVALDRMWSKRKLMLAILSVVAATHEPLLALNLLRDAGDAPPLSACDAEMEDDALLLSFVNGQSKLLAQFALVVSAAEPFFRAKVNYSVGPERYSFSRLERQFGNSTSCKATFRFDAPGLKRVFAALKFPEVIVTRSRFSATGEEVFLYMLKRLSYPATLSTLAWDCGRSISAQSELFQVHAKGAAHERTVHARTVHERTERASHSQIVNGGRAVDERVALAFFC